MSQLLCLKGKGSLVGKVRYQLRVAKVSEAALVPSKSSSLHKLCTYGNETSHILVGCNPKFRLEANTGPDHFSKGM